MCSNNSKSSQEILLTQSTTPTTLISNTQHQICAAFGGDAHYMSKAEVTSSSFKRSYSGHQQQWIRVPWSSRMQVSINPKGGERTKLFPALALKEKCVPQTVSWTWDGAYATNTTSAQPCSEVSLTYSLAFNKVAWSGYALGCYHDPYPPHHLSGDFHHIEANFSVAACVKACGEDGYMLAGLRWISHTKTCPISSTSGIVSSATAAVWNPPLGLPWGGICVERNVLLRNGRKHTLQTPGQWPCMSLVVKVTTPW